MDQETIDIRTWQWAKHAWLYSDLLQALKRGRLSALGSQHSGP